jgi:hypothetical protein
MKSFFFMGRNTQTKSGVSWKMWRIERKSASVTTWWGPAIVEARRVIPANTLQSKTVRFRSDEAAKAHEESRIKSKLAKGYEARPVRSH